VPGIPPESLDDVWLMIEPYLLRAMEKGEYGYDIEDVKISCQIGEYILWIVRNGKAAIILEVSDYLFGKQCDIVMLGGDGIDDWLKELQEIEGWASRVGCNRMILTGRQGWKKKLADYKVKTVTMVKEL